MNATNLSSLGARLSKSAILLLALASCSGGGGDNPTAPGGQGTLSVLLTDSPSDELSEVQVYISGFTIKPSGGSVQRIASNLGLVDLLTLKDVTKLLLTAGVAAGEYEFIQIELDQDQSYVVEKSTGDELPLRIPSEEIKVLGGFSVDRGSTTTITLDFDAGQSLVKQGNGQWLLRPVIIQTNVTKTP